MVVVFSVLFGVGFGSSWSARAAWNLRGTTIESAMRSSLWIPYLVRSGMLGLDRPLCSHLSVSLLMRAREVRVCVRRLWFLQRVFLAGFGGSSNVVLCD